MTENKIYLPDIVGKHYKEFWHFKGRYRVVKGSRASKKSKTAALWFIYNMMKHKDANLLVVRGTLKSVKDSCWTDLRWAAQRLGVLHLWESTKNPLELTYLPTGQKILFRGMDDPLKITSIAVEKGVLSWGWVEEAYEIDTEEDFNMLDGSIRGETPPHLWKQWTLTFNPWLEQHWLKARFFDRQDPNILAMTTNFTMNEWLDDNDLQWFEELRVHNPRYYLTAGLGEWGVISGHVFDMFTNDNIYDHELPQGYTRYIAIDYGTNNATAFLDIYHIEDKHYVTREYYYDSTKKGVQKTDSEYLADLKEFIGDAGDTPPKLIIIDPSAASFKLEVYRAGYKTKNANNDVLEGIRHTANLFAKKQVLVHKSCENLIKEIYAYRWDEKAANRGKEQPIKENDHAVDALRYYCETIVKNPRKFVTVRRLR